MTRFAAAGFLLLLASTGAPAQPVAPVAAPGNVPLPAPQRTQISQPAFVHQPVCMTDVKKFCSKVKLGQGRVRACLTAHRPQLSPFCQQKLAYFEKWLADRKAYPGGLMFHREGHNTTATSPAKSTAPQTPSSTQRTTPPKQ
jgi:hypothetical protein